MIESPQAARVKQQPKESPTTKEEAPDSLLAVKFDQAKTLSRSIEELERSMISPILRNPLMIPVVPMYDPKANYYLEVANWQSFYQMGSGANQSLQQMVHKLKYSVSELDELVTKYKSSATKKYMHKKNRRTAQQINRSFKCPYQDCFKIYGSDVSMNLHIKIKHRGGTKTEREKLALQICEAEKNGLTAGPFDLVFPPGFVDEYRRRFEIKSELMFKVEFQQGA